MEKIKKREKLKKILSEMSADAFYLTSSYNVRYFTDFSGSNGTVVLTPDRNVFFTDFRYIEQAKNQVEPHGFEIVKVDKSMTETVNEYIVKNGIKRIIVEDKHITISGFKNLKNKFKDIEFLFAEDKIEKIRMEKSEKEIGLIKKAVEITDKSFCEILEKIKPGISEKEIANELEYIMKKNGADDRSFETIVASGYRSAMPHGVASEKLIANNEFVKLDFGCYYSGYVSDMTRTVFVGNNITEKHLNVYNTVLEAQKLAICSVKAGITTIEIDKIARDYITSKGYGENFGHGLGHGIGLEIHEMPSLSSKLEAIVLTENMVVTIEPGIYIEGFGGVRIEDDIVVTKNGCEVLNKSTKELIIK